MLIVAALIPLIVVFLLLLICRWRSRDVGWITLGVTVVLVSLVPAFYRTPWQIVLSLGEGAAAIAAIGVIVLPALFFCQMQQETGATAILMNGLASRLPFRVTRVCCARTPMRCSSTRARSA